MNSFILDKHRGLFRDEEAFNQFVSQIKEASREDLSVMYSKQEMIGAVLSPEGAQSFLLERMLKRLSKKPELLEEITDRLECDEIVD
jgi:hypothetical protein